MIVCAEQTLRDFGVIVHEMGHLQYFMAYKDQPTVFQVREFAHKIKTIFVLSNKLN